MRIGILSRTFAGVVRLVTALAVMVWFAGWQPAMAQIEGAAPDPRLGCDKVDVVVPPANLSEPDNIDLFKRRLLYYRCFAYERDITDVIDRATAWVKARAPHVSNPAMVLDIDETSLVNWPRIYQDGYAFFSSFPGGACGFARQEDTCGDLDWQRKGYAKAIGATLKLYKLARCIEQSQPCTPIEVFFVTGRKDKEYEFRDEKGNKTVEKATDWTLKNLKEAGYSGIAPDRLYMRDANSTGSAAYHKIPARADIERKGFRIIANIGDQNSDLIGGYAEMTFKLPNPFYFID